MTTSDRASGKKGWKRAGGVLATLLGLLLVLQLLPPRGVVPGQNPWRPRPGQPPLIIAHGGGQGLHPANTLAAFSHSVTSHCDALEMDLRLTKDAALVTHHDETIDRTSDGTGPVVAMTLAELRERNFGHHFMDPTGAQPYRDHPARLAALEELFQAFPKMPMIVELKDRGTNGARAAAVLAGLIERYQRAPLTIVASFDDATLAEFQRVSAGTAFTAAPLNRTKAFVILSRLHLDWFAPQGNQALQIPVEKYGYRLDFPRLLSSAHRRNLAVHYWTINDPAEMRRLVLLGADGIMTDRPDLLRQVLAGSERTN
jgi:glycerophosphoryl diester phosphodiesterase